jgi:hypothetical protein
MSYQEKRTITSIFTGALVLAAYCFYAFGKAGAGAVAPGDLKFWATTILVFIGIGIVAMIIIQIIFHILLSIAIAVQKRDCDSKEVERAINADMVEDERDKLIELKASRIGLVFGGAGFIGALVSLLIGYSAAVMLNIMFLSFCVGSLFEGFAHLYYYRRGVKNG